MSVSCFFIDTEKSWFEDITKASKDKGLCAEITTTDMNIPFLAPCRSNCTAEATVIKFGKTLCPVSVTLCDMNGTQVALAQVTYMRLGEVRPQTSEG